MRVETIHQPHGPVVLSLHHQWWILICVLCHISINSASWCLACISFCSKSYIYLLYYWLWLDDNEVAYIYRYVHYVLVIFLSDCGVSDFICHLDSICCKTILNLVKLSFTNVPKLCKNYQKMPAQHGQQLKKRKGRLRGRSLLYKFTNYRDRLTTDCYHFCNRHTDDAAATGCSSSNMGWSRVDYSWCGASCQVWPSWQRNVASSTVFQAV